MDVCACHLLHVDNMIFFFFSVSQKKKTSFLTSRWLEWLLREFREDVPEFASMSSRLESFRAHSGVPGVGAFFEERFPTVSEAVGKLRFCWAKRKTPLDFFRFFLAWENIGFWYLI